MRNISSFSTKNNFLDLFAGVWVRTYFSLESLIIGFIEIII